MASNGTDNAGVPGQVDVVVVGCGPVGAMLANLLGLQGISTLVLDRDAAIYPLPRAVHFDDEVMRLLQTIGLASEIAPTLNVSPGMHFVDDAGRRLIDWSRPLGIGPQGWNASYRFHQPALEAVLRRGFARWPGVSLRKSCEVLSVDPAVEGIEVRYRAHGSAQTQVIQACYVVGCDGARSLVRRAIGGGLEDLGFHERWLVVDVILRRPRPDLGDHSIQFCSKTRPATYVRGTGDRRRWEITVLPGEDDADLLRPEKVFDLLRPWIGAEEASLERAAVYKFHSVIARHWRSGRLLIAGDAAHMTPPFLGQGMCAGMRDAGNLAWKLARVLRGRSADDLLDSYQSERSPHVREYIELAVRLGGLINTKAAAVAIGDAVAGGEPVRMSSIKPLLGRGLGDGWPAPRGSVAPQPTLRDGRRMDDCAGYRFLAVLQPALRETLAPGTISAMAAADAAVVCTDEAPELADWLASWKAQAILIRPDRYVVGAASDAAGLRRLLGAATSLPANAPWDDAGATV